MTGHPDWCDRRCCTVEGIGADLHRAEHRSSYFELGSPVRAIAWLAQEPGGVLGVGLIVAGADNGSVVTLPIDATLAFGQTLVRLAGMAGVGPAIPPLHEADDDIAVLDLRGIHANVEGEDGVALLVLRDGDTTVVLHPGLGAHGHSSAAAAGAEKAAEVIGLYGATLRGYNASSGGNPDVRPAHRG